MMAAEKFLECMESLGLGNIDKRANGKSNVTRLFRKQKFEDMPTEAKNKLRKLNITEEQYTQSMAADNQ